MQGRHTEDLQQTDMEKKRMVHVNWDSYVIWYHKKRCRILIPRDIPQFRAIYYQSPEKLIWPDFELLGNRKELEALRNACAVLSEMDNTVIYFPCKKNKSEYGDFDNDCCDLVLMKPNSVVIKNWKNIRKYIPKTKKRQWGYDFPCGFENMHKKQRYEYQKGLPKMIRRFDTIFFNASGSDYSDLASRIKDSLPSLEKRFYKDIHDNGFICDEMFSYSGPEFWMTFWDDDIFQKAKEDKRRNEDEK